MLTEEAEKKPVWVTEPRVAEMLTGVAAATALVDTVNVAEVAPAGIVTDVPGKKTTVGLSLVTAITACHAGRRFLQAQDLSYSDQGLIQDRLLHPTPQAFGNP